MFSLCIPTMDRYDNFLSNYLDDYINNELISEIIITDENGNDIDKIIKKYPNNNKLILIKNKRQLGILLNKMKVCKLATNEWIALIDSDNYASHDYFITAKNYIENVINEQKNIILAPSKANPNFNFKFVSGVIYKNGNIRKNSTNILTECLMNTGNYVINKYLIDNLYIPNNIDPGPYDVIYLNILMFKQLDLNMHIVDNLEYSHVVHDDSTYLKTNHKYRKLYNKIRMMYYRLI
jgi:hypothetical protein